MKFLKATYEFEMNERKNGEGWFYSAQWSINETAPDLNRKYEVSIFRGGGYRVSYYSDHRPCEKNSREYIEQYLKSLASPLP